MTNHFYGEAPTEIGYVDLSRTWTEFMHYLYLPVCIPASDRPSYSGTEMGLPERLGFLWPSIRVAMHDARLTAPHLQDPYVYVTARRGYATPGNPLNRPGWHCDDFGGTDLNYIWCDEFPTRVLRSEDPLPIPPDDAQSMYDMKNFAELAEMSAVERIWIDEAPTDRLMRLTPYVIHNTPIITLGGMRSFFKISISTHRYNLIGNSHNYEINYDWPMHSRESLRNQPSGANRDYTGGAR